MDRARPVVAGTKFGVPRIPNATIKRTHLLDRLDAGAACRLTTVVAAAGSGKTALLADWVDSLTCPTAWLSCDSVDADPRAFWDDVISAVRAAWFPSDLVGADAADVDEQASDVAVRLGNSLASVDAHGVIVLDDYHMAQPDAATMLAFLAALPPTVRLVLGSRIAPTFPLGRLRVQGNLLELRQLDLSFSIDETRAILAGLDVVLDATELKTLDLLVEGWPAGVHLAGLALRTTPDREALLRGLAESEHDITDFLTSEVVDAQPPDIQRFMMATAELRLFDAALCDAVLDRTDSAAMLEQVRARSLFLTRVGASGSWFRYHHLFGAFLRARLRAKEPGRAVELHAAAASAYIARGDLMSAIRHYVAADDLPSAGRLLRESVLSNLSVADQALATTAARACLATVHDSPIETSASHILDCAAALTMAGAVREAEPWLRILTAAEARLEPHARCQLHTVWAQHLLSLGEPDAALEHATAADAIATSNAAAAYAPSLLAVLTARLHLLRERYDEARAALDRIPLTDQLDQSRPAVHLNGARAMVEMYAGELADADRLALAALRTADDLDLEKTNDSRAYALLTLSALAIERDELDEANTRLEQTLLMLGDGRRPALAAETRLHLALASAIRGDEESALAHLDNARAAQPRAAAAVRARINRIQLQVCLDLGDIVGAEAALARLTASAPDQLLAARIHLRSGRNAEGSMVLNRVGPALSTRRLRVEHGVLCALCLAARHDDEALPTLEAVLRLAQPVEFVRTIIGEGPGMWALLEALPTDSELTTYVERLLAAAERVLPVVTVPGRSALVDPLTEREMAVLRYLASRLDTSGIAEAMYLSANTVRSHVKSIYRKLGVNARADAVARGRRLGLFGSPSR